MKFFNSLTRQKDEFMPLDGKNIKMYACGPTVYNYFHVGNARCFVIFDFLRRYLEYTGYNVKFVQNFTDIDDKMIKKANEENTTVKEIAERYIKEYFVDAKGLGINPATIHPRATENIDQIIEIVKTLEIGKYAYSVYPEGESVNKDVYFSTKKFKDYGKLSHMNLDDLESGARIDVSDIKKDPMDFALWKAEKPGEPAWDSPWGKGRPGWHIECSAMAKRYLGENIDIHCGGQDLTFPHHENEIAQSECYDSCVGCKDTTFSRFWLHNGYINVDGVKMSKSLNNFFTVRDAAKVYSYDAIRYFLISAYYRSQVNYSEEALKQATASLQRIRTCEENLRFRISKNENSNAISAEELQKFQKFIKIKEEMCTALEDDFNTADAIASVFDLVRDINTALQEENITNEFLQKALDFYMEIVCLFGFEIKKEENGDDAEIEEQIAHRVAAKKAKDFVLADKIRDDLKLKGIILEDTPQGVKWKKV